MRLQRTLCTTKHGTNTATIRFIGADQRDTICICIMVRWLYSLLVVVQLYTV